jgi:hypothetical protein
VDIFNVVKQVDPLDRLSSLSIKFSSVDPHLPTEDTENPKKEGMYDNNK